MAEWFERRGRRYLRASWTEASALERRGMVEVSAWEVLDEPARGDRVFREREPHEWPAEKTEARSGEAGTTSAGSTAPAEEPAEAPVEEEPRAWIEVELQDHEGKPVPGETCRITLTNGKVVERATDKYGVVRVDGIDPGKCEVTFPRLKDGTWAPV